MDFKQDNLTPEDIRKVILNTPMPLLIQNKLKCDLISWNLKNWEDMLKDELLKFRCGKYQYSIEPQWEMTCLTKQATFREFLDTVDMESNEWWWWYFDYKYLCEWFTDKQELKEKIDWSALGFPEVTANESTIWIGSKGAHTSCHMDTYGCNIILQVYGRKQWILFPPDENLKPTRIPFEESSIYSKLNFFSPRQKDFRGINHCHKVILNPGDVLVLPHRWWHYVENLDTAISINVWIPLPQDNSARIKESIATILIGQMAKTHADFKNTILNPNMIDEMVSCDQALDILTVTLHQDKPTSNNLKIGDQRKTNQEENDANLDQILNHNKCISKVPSLSEEEFRLFLRSQLERFTVTENHQEDDKNLQIKKVIDFLEAITDDEVLSLIAKKLSEKR